MGATKAGVVAAACRRQRPTMLRGAPRGRVPCGSKTRLKEPSSAFAGGVTIVMPVLGRCVTGATVEPPTLAQSAAAPAIYNRPARLLRALYLFDVAWVGISDLDRLVFRSCCWPLGNAAQGAHGLRTLPLGYRCDSPLTQSTTLARALAAYTRIRTKLGQTTTNVAMPRDGLPAHNLGTKFSHVATTACMDTWHEQPVAMVRLVAQTHVGSNARFDGLRQPSRQGTTLPATVQGRSTAKKTSFSATRTQPRRSHGISTHRTANSSEPPRPMLHNGFGAPSVPQPGGATARLLPRFFRLIAFGTPWIAPVRPSLPSEAAPRP